MNVDLIFDASFCPKLKIGTYSFFLICGGSRWGSAGQLKNTTSPHEAELMALANALHRLKNSTMNNGTISFITIHSDCMNIFGTMIHDTKNSIAKEAIRNIELIKAKNLEMRYTTPFFKMKHVKAHSAKKDTISRANEFCHNNALIQLQLRREKIDEENTIQRQQDEAGREVPKDLFVDSGRPTRRPGQVPVSMRSKV